MQESGSFLQDSPYDAISYPGHPYKGTHPDHLGVLGALYGMKPPLASQCRYLELGCGVGGNLLPLAFQFPNSEFVGIDLSGREIEKAKESAAHYGLGNVSLHQGDIATVDQSWGRFDYIVSHGVYSWVPPPVRQAMMRIFGHNLSPQGIAYVSYNAHPGSHMRDLVRDAMNFHVRDLDDPKKKVAQARAILKFIAEGSDKNTVYGAVVREQLERVQRMGDEVLYHDDLNVISRAFLLHEVVAEAVAQGLQYLSDTTLSRRNLSKYSEEVQQVLGGFPPDQFLARDQFQDFIDGHGFRCTLLCRADIALDRDPNPESLAQFQLTCSASPVDATLDLTKAERAAFKTDAGDVIEVDHPLTKAALFELGRRWPGALSWDELRATIAGGQRALPHDDVEAMRNALFAAAFHGHVVLHREAPIACATVSARPEASALARKQAERVKLVTNLTHIGVLLEDERVRRLVTLADGTRDLDALVAALRAADADLPDGVPNQPIDRDSVRQRLEFLARLALLVR